MKEIYQQTVEEVLERVNGKKSGLTSEQVKRSREKCGWNELTEGKKKGILQIFFEQYKDFLVLILIASAIISGMLGDVESAAVIVTVITINAILGTIQTVKAEQSLQSLKNLSGPEAKVLRDGTVVQIPARELVVGDVILLEAGDMIPADGRLIENASLKIDESALTGESLAVEKNMDTILTEAPLGDRTNMLFSGSFVTYGRGKAVVTDIGMQTEVGKIAGLLKSTSEKQTPLQVSLEVFGKKLSIMILVFCGLLFAINVFRGEKISSAFMFAVALAVAAIPEALSSIVTIVLSFGTQKMAKEHAIIRKLQAVEGLGSVSIICSDKTGTLTQNKMTVEDYYIDGKRISAEAIDISDQAQKCLLNYSILCNDSTNENGVEIGDPTETALINLGSRYGIEAASVRKLYPRNGELPFDSDRKMMSTLHLIDGKNQMIVKGAVDKLLERTEQIWTKEGIRKITEEDKEKIQRQNQEFSMEGLRVLAFTYREIPKNHTLTIQDEDHLVFLGLIAMMDPPREESKAAVAECIKAGIRPVMITGDHKITAAAIAKRVGILHDLSEACEGADIENMSDEELKEFVSNISVYARVSPEHKIRIVRAWQKRGNIVAMTGDGVNDAPALASADVGIAIGAGTDVAIESADIVLMKNDLLDAVGAVKLSKAVIRNIKENLFWAFFYNSIGIPLAAGVLYPLFQIKLNPMFGAAAMSLSSVCVVSNALRLRWVKLHDAKKTQSEPHQDVAASTIADINQHNALDNNIKSTNNDKGESTMTTTISIEGMMCAHCQAHVEKALKEVAGVTEVTVSLENKNAVVTGDASVEALKQAVVDAGYEVTDVK